MDISLIIFFLGLTPTNDVNAIKTQWEMLNTAQKLVLIKQFESEYQVSLQYEDKLPDNLTKKAIFRAFDQM